MDVIDTKAAIKELAADHLLLHFAAVPAPGAPPLVIAGGDGIHLEDVDGRRYLDGLAGLFTVQVGYSAGAELGEAAAEQMLKLPYASNWGIAHPAGAELAATLARLTPGDLNRSFFVSSGSEAVESAWKLAREYHLARGERRWRAIARANSYHGTTLGALSITGIPGARADFEPLVPEVVHVRDTKRTDSELDEATHTAALLREVEAAIEASGPTTVAMMIVEPVQTSGGSLVPPAGYLEGLHEICDHYGILLCADEVLNGFGRLGTWFGSERFGLEPDLLTCAKGISSGYAPVAAVVCTERVAATLRNADRPFNHGSTFGGHPVAAAISSANLELMERTDLVAHVAANEGAFRARLERLAELPMVRSISGIGYLQAIELCAPDGRDLGSQERADLLQRVLLPDARERGLICRFDPRSAAIVQLAPPLIAGPEDFEEICSILEDSFREAFA